MAKRKLSKGGGTNSLRLGMYDCFGPLPTFRLSSGQSYPATLYYIGDFFIAYIDDYATKKLHCQERP
jgi:hypothetical protein